MSGAGRAPVESESPLALAVVNPGGRDPEQHFAHGAPVGEGPHAPINYHAYAAATRGSFYRDPERLLPQQRAALVLLRGDLKAALSALAKLQASGRKVAIAIKEAGRHQIIDLLSHPRRLETFRTLCRMADFCLASTPDLVPVYLGAGAARAEFIPTPYPVDLPDWDFSTSLSQRHGVMIGTREFEVPTRNHLPALLAARTLSCPVTVINRDGRSGRKQLAALDFPNLTIIEGPLPYPDYLRLMSRHRLVFQLDRSGVPGQVAGDALLCRIPCVGGDGAVESLAFPQTSGHGRTTPELLTLANQLLSDPGSPPATARPEAVSYPTVAIQLQAAFA